MASYEPRGGSIRVTVRMPGGRREKATFDTRAQAEAWAAEMERKKELGQFASAADPLVAELWSVYLDRVASKTDTAKWNALRIGRWMSDPLAKRRLRTVTTHDINEWVDRRLNQRSKLNKTISPATAARELTLMSAAFRYGVESLKWIATNPCRGAQRLEEGPPRSRPLLTQPEIRAITAAAGMERDPLLETKSARVCAAWLLALETGMRSGEILRLRPEDIDFDRRVIRVTATEQGGRKGAKSGRVRGDPGRSVPATARAIELLSLLLVCRPADQPYVVGMTDARRDALWRKIRDRSGVRDLHFHDSKHEAATRLSRFVDVFALSHAIGTKDLKLLRDVYYNNDAARAAQSLPPQLLPEIEPC